MIFGLCRGVTEPDSRAGGSRTVALSAHIQFLKLQILACGLFFLCLTPVQAQLSVGSTGQASYVYPLAVPPSRGHEPNLELRYTGGDGGVVGHGWSLVAGVQITRCAANKAIDSAIGSVDFTATDKLCMNGSRLIALDGDGKPVVGRATRDAEGFASSTTYKEFRLESEPKIRVRAYGRSGTSVDEGPAYFKVWNPDGGVLTLGIEPGDAASKAAVKGSYTSYASTTMIWLLATASDASGNLIHYFYDTKAYSFGSVVKPYVPGQFLTSTPTSAPTAGWDTVLKEVQYGGANKIVFGYSDRANVAGAWQERLFRGHKTVSVRQLDSISTYVGASSASVGNVSGAVAAHSFKFSYTNGPKSGRLLLQDVRRCAGDANSMRCLPSSSFTYSIGHDLQYTEEAQFNLSGEHLLRLGIGRLSGKARGVIAADFNGDGRTDLLVRQESPSYDAVIYKSDGGGRFSLWTDPALLDTEWRIDWLVRDFNGDGLPDIYRKGELLINSGNGFIKRAVSGLQEEVSGFAKYNVGSYENPDGPYHVYLSARNIIFMDVNGDGRLDAITSEMLGNLSSEIPRTPCVEVCTRVYFGDGVGGFSEASTNISKLLLVQQGIYRVGGGGIVDLNGDGLQDLVHQNPACSLYYETSGEICAGELISRGDGNFDLRATTALRTLLNPDEGAFGASASTIEVQGDGTPEFVNFVALGYNKKVALSADPLFSADAYITIQSTGAPAPLGYYRSGVQALDLNGDGRTDLLELYSKEIAHTYWDVTDARVYISDGTGMLKYSNVFNIPASAFGSFEQGIVQYGPLSHFRKQVLVGNFTGRSNQEFLSLSDGYETPFEGNKLYTMRPQAPADVLVSVTEGLKGTSTIAYAPAAATDRVIVHRNAQPGQIDVAPSGYIATSLTTPSGVGSRTNVVEYAYAGLKSDRNGRGSLGYAQSRQQATSPNGQNLTSVTVHSQQFPYVGAALRTETYISNLMATEGAQLLSRTTQAYCDAGNDEMVRGNAIANETSCAPVVSVLKKPYIVLSKRTAKDLDGSDLPAQRSVVTVNSLAYVTETATTTTHLGQQFQTINGTSYAADDTACSAVDICRWWIARPEKMSVRKTAPSAIGATTAGQAPLATAMTGTLSGSAGQELSSIMSVIINLLLSDD